MIEVSPLGPEDRTAWEVLARAYKDFYETVLPDQVYDETWRRLIADDAIHGVGAHIGGALVGIAHYLYHANIWGSGSCYLQDLYVDEVARRQGAATALIERVADDAQKAGLTRLYWHTKQDNSRARRLYEKVARFRGFIVYDQPLSRAPLPTGCRD